MGWSVKQWDIMLVYWQHLDHLAKTAGKSRPALLISGDEEIKAGRFLFMKISTQKYPGVPDLRGRPNCKEGPARE